jgi:hypothetical protein
LTGLEDVGALLEPQVLSLMCVEPCGGIGTNILEDLLLLVSFAHSAVDQLCDGSGVSVLNGPIVCYQCPLIWREPIWGEGCAGSLPCDGHLLGTPVRQGVLGLPDHSRRAGCCPSVATHYGGDRSYRSVWLGTSCSLSCWLHTACAVRRFGCRTPGHG